MVMKNILNLFIVALSFPCFHSLGAEVPETCSDAECQAVKSEALLQVRSEKPAERELASEFEELQASARNSLSTLTKATSKVVASELHQRSMAQLPNELVTLGIELLGSQEALDSLVANSRWVNVTYGGVNVLTRMFFGQQGNTTFMDWPDSYGVDSLHELQEKSNSKYINMLDIGGNHGVISIAAYLRYPARLRAVMVEPIPSTYFVLRWNMWLNGVPALDEAAFKEGTKTGILALNRAVSNDNQKGIDMCYWPPHTQTATICDCQDKRNKNQFLPGEQCMHVGGVTTRSLVGYFGLDPITMLKVDCEGCEYVSMPVIAQVGQESPLRITRLAGELHWPTRDLEDVACKYELGKFFIRHCDQGDLPLDCGVNPKPCLRNENIQEHMDQKRKLQGL
jgi:FkbM family methyltransferase